VRIIQRRRRRRRRRSKTSLFIFLLAVFIAPLRALLVSVPRLCFSPASNVIIKKSWKLNKRARDEVTDWDILVKIKIRMCCVKSEGGGERKFLLFFYLFFISAKKSLVIETHNVITFTHSPSLSFSCLHPPTPFPKL
jgi:hypothetical protein